jgi:hypothetical protein
MATLQIKLGDSFAIDVNVRDGDEHTQTPSLEIVRHFLPEGYHESTEIFLQPAEIAQIGRFLLQQADRIGSVK